MLQLMLLSLIYLVTFSTLTYAEGKIAFNTDTCTSEDIAFLTPEFQSTFSLIGQTTLLIGGPQYYPTILNYVVYLFGFERDVGPHGETSFSPMDFLVWVYGGGRPEYPTGLGLTTFLGNEFVSEDEATEFQDVVVYCSPSQFTTDSEQIEIVREDGTVYEETFYWDAYYEIWTATSLVDPCRDQNNPTSPILMGNSRTKAKPSVMTFCPWYLAAAKTAVLPDLFIVSEQLGSRLMSEPEFSLPAGTTVVDLYVMIKHIILLGLVETWVAAGGGSDQITEISMTNIASGFTACTNIHLVQGAQGPENNPESYMFFGLLVDLERNSHMDFALSGTRWETSLLVTEVEIAELSPVSPLSASDSE